MGSLLRQAWNRLSEELSLSVLIPDEIVFPDGTRIVVDVRLMYFGGTNGTIIVSDFEKIKGRTNELVLMGFGYSCLTEPEKLVSSDEDLESTKEMLSEWGYTGDTKATPGWYREYKTKEDSGT